MKLYQRTCKNSMCGKVFIGTRTQQYCCPGCRIPTYKPKRKNKKIQKCTLDEVARQAKELGISYGKYVTMQYETERKNK